jgi:hypothetical protein
MRYAYVKDGQIVDGPRSLPKSWGNTSGFDLMSDEELRAVGWLPWKFIEVQRPEDNWVLDTSVVAIGDTEITETQTYRQKTQDEINADIANQIESNRQARATAYREEADPLFFKSERGEATREEWLAKVQEIRNRYPT